MQALSQANAYAREARERLAKLDANPNRTERFGKFSDGTNKATLPLSENYMYAVLNDKLSPFDRQNIIDAEYGRISAYIADVMSATPRTDHKTAINFVEDYSLFEYAGFQGLEAGRAILTYNDFAKDVLGLSRSELTAKLMEAKRPKLSESEYAAIFAKHLKNMVSAKHLKKIFREL